MSVTIHTGDALSVLRTMDAESVQCCVTSPPYFGLRDYGHPGQIGLEATPEEYVAALVAVFAEVRRVMREDATLWVNLGDSYGATGGDTHSGFNQRYFGTGGAGSKQDSMLDGVKSRTVNTGLRPKNLLGIPWRVAFALQADGWYLRSDIIWHKPNPMPESVTDRCTKAHEYIFMLAKSEQYYFDAGAIAEPALQPVGEPEEVAQHKQWVLGTNQNGTLGTNQGRETRNKRSVWTVATSPYSEAHFATFPPDLIRPCILAGCPVGGTVLDPFGGSGTTGEVAEQEGRHAVLIELNPEYVKLAKARTAQTGLLHCA